jgi:hypothetical protein
MFAADGLKKGTKKGKGQLLRREAGLGIVIRGMEKISHLHGEALHRAVARVRENVVDGLDLARLEANAGILNNIHSGGSVAGVVVGV